MFFFLEKRENKAVYTATPVAGGWAGAVMSWAGAVDGLFDIADNNNGFFGLMLIITLFGVSISCDLLHQTF